MFLGHAVQHGGRWGRALAAGWSTQQAGEMWKTLAGGLGTRRRPGTQTHTVAEDGGVGCPERSLGPGPQCRNADTGAGAAKGERPKRMSVRRREGKEEGKRQEAGAREGGSPRSPVGGPGSGSPGPGPTRQGRGHSATGPLRSAVSSEKHYAGQSHLPVGAGLGELLTGFQSLEGEEPVPRSGAPRAHSPRARLGKLLLPQPGPSGHMARRSAQPQTTKSSLPL